MRFSLRERGLCSRLLASRSSYLLSRSLGGDYLLALYWGDDGLIHSDVFRTASYSAGAKNKAIQRLIGWQFDL